MKDKPTRIETESKICAHAWKDPAFKKKLLSDPREALKDLGMKNIPDKIHARVLEEKPNEWCIVLREAPPNAKSLSEEELKNIYAAKVNTPCACS